MQEEKIRRRLSPSFLPSTAVLEMTYRCNHACLFCSCPWFAPHSQFDIRPELSVGEWKGIIRKLCQMGCDNLAFTGGEPLLKQGIEEIIEFAAECQAEHIESKDGSLVSTFRPPKLYLLSNGKAMREDILTLCHKHHVNLSMSLPGLTTFLEHNQGGTTPEHILGWFRKAHQMGVTTTVGVTVTQKNLFELYETIAEALLAGADNLLMNRFLPGGRGISYARELNITREQIVEMLDTAETVLKEANRFGSVGTELPQCLFDGKKYKQISVGTRCSAAISFFVIDPSGYVRVCNHSPIRLNHMNELEQVKTHPYWRLFAVKDYLPCECNSCKVMGKCDGGCREAAHIVSGKVDSLDPVMTDLYSASQ